MADTATIRGKTYVSYAWSDESPEGRDREALVDRFCAAAEARGVKIIRDKTDVKYHDRISEFMGQIGRADRIFIFLSDKYLKSLYCMSELFDVWRNCRSNATEFIERTCVFSLNCAKYGTQDERSECALYWTKVFDERHAFAKSNYSPPPPH